MDIENQFMNILTIRCRSEVNSSWITKDIATSDIEKILFLKKSKKLSNYNCLMFALGCENVLNQLENDGRWYLNFNDTLKKNLQNIQEDIDRLKDDIEQAKGKFYGKDNNIKDDDLVEQVVLEIKRKIIFVVNLIIKSRIDDINHFGGAYLGWPTSYDSFSFITPDKTQYLKFLSIQNTGNLCMVYINPFEVADYHYARLFYNNNTGFVWLNKPDGSQSIDKQAYPTDNPTINTTTTIWSLKDLEEYYEHYCKQIVLCLDNYIPVGFCYFSGNFTGSDNLSKYWKKK